VEINKICRPQQLLTWIPGVVYLSVNTPQFNTSASVLGSKTQHDPIALSGKQIKHIAVAIGLTPNWTFSSYNFFHISFL
jgi:hypothetical protein